MDSLIIYKNEFNKIRLGSNNDGGYVISDLPNGYDYFISCGISDNVDFEVDFINKYNIHCQAFDGTINDLPRKSKNIFFHKKNIGVDDNNNTTNLKSIIENYKDIMLKMDIETFEFRWFDILSNEELNKFKQIVVEFHFPFSDYSLPNLDKPTSCNFKMNILKKLSESHYLIHLHPNTACGTTNYKGITVPNVFECTYVRKNCQQNIGYNNVVIPHPLDMKNRITDNEIYLSGYPFTF
jgi:hypothetical protein